MLLVFNNNIERYRVRKTHWKKGNTLCNDWRYNKVVCCELNFVKIVKKSYSYTSMNNEHLYNLDRVTCMRYVSNEIKSCCCVSLTDFWGESIAYFAFRLSCQKLMSKKYSHLNLEFGDFMVCLGRIVRDPWGRFTNLSQCSQYCNDTV